MLANQEEKYQPKTLIVSGGGVKGRAYAPVISALQETDILPGITDVYGSSVGALMAAMLSLGYSPKEIQQQLDADVSSYQDAAKVHDSRLPVLASKVLRNFLKDGALFKGEKLATDCQSLLNQAGFDTHATFADLAKLVENKQQSASGMPYRNVHITATVSDPRGSYQIILDAQTAPNMPIALALRASAALPPAFRPVIITPEQMAKYTQGATQDLVQYDRGPAYHDKMGNDTRKVDLHQKVKLIDGGVVDNLPQYAAYDPNQPDQMLSLNLAATQSLERKARYKNIPYSEEQEKNCLIEREALEGLMRQAFKSALKICRPPVLELATRDCTMDIPTHDVNAADFDMQREVHQKLVDDAHESVVAFLNKKGVDTSKVTKPTIEESAPIASIPEVILNARACLQQVGLGYEQYPNMKDVVKVADEARDYLQGKKGNANQTIVYETQFQFKQLVEISNQVMRAAKSPDLNKEQKKELQDLDKRLKVALRVQRFEGIESKAQLAGVKMVKDVLKGVSKNIKGSKSIVNAVLIKNTEILIQKTKMGLEEIQKSVPADLKEDELNQHLHEINQALKSLSKQLKSNPKSQSQVEEVRVLRQDLIGLQEALRERLKTAQLATTDSSNAKRSTPIVPHFRQDLVNLDNVQKQNKTHPAHSEMDPHRKSPKM